MINSSFQFVVFGSETEIFGCFRVVSGLLSLLFTTFTLFDQVLTSSRLVSQGLQQE